MDFVKPAYQRLKLKESEKSDKYLDLAWEEKKTMEHESDSAINCNWWAHYSHKRIGTHKGGLWN